MNPRPLRLLGLGFGLLALGCTCGGPRDIAWVDTGWWWDSGGTTVPDTGWADQDADGWWVVDGDCDDLDPEVNPGAEDLVGDDRDQNCDGVDGFDGDQDGVASAESGGADCDDGDADRYPGAPELPEDGVDQDCDGVDPEAASALWVGDTVSCAAFTSGTRCWGEGADELTPQTVTVELAIGATVACAVDELGEPSCWGHDDQGLLAGLPAGPVHGLGLGTWHGCALDAESLPRCWGADYHGQVSEAPELALTGLSVAPQGGCGLDAEGSLHCWGADFVGQASPPEGSFASLDAGARFGCALDPEQELSCWGDAPEPPSLGDARLTSVQVGDAFACGLLEDGAPLCWGALPGPMPALPALDVLAVGRTHACGLTPLGEVLCWGSDSHGQLSPW